MRIALVRRACSLKKAGAEKYCVNLFRQLQKLGHDVTVVGEQIDEELRQEVAFLPVPVLKLTSWTRNQSFAHNAARVVSKWAFDVVHGLSRVDGLDTYRLTDPLQTHWVRVFYRNAWRRRLESWNPRHQAIFKLEQRLFGPEGPRRIIVQSQVDAGLLQQYFGIAPSRLRLVRNGVDLQQFGPGDGRERAEIREKLELSPRQPLLAFAAMDFRRKGLGSLIEAMSISRDRDSVLMVLGQGDIDSYQRLADQHGVGDRIRFLGRQSQMARYYRAADAFVLPTIYEPFPNVLLESMACGTPVITTRTAGGADLVTPGDQGYLIADAWDVSTLAEQIDRLLSASATTRSVMREACLERAREFPVERNARETLAVLTEVQREKLCA